MTGVSAIGIFITLNVANVELWIEVTDIFVHNRAAVEPLGFAPKFFDTIQDNLVHFATSQGGSFVILSLAEEESTKKKTLKALKPHKAELQAAAESSGDEENSKGNLGAKMLIDLLNN